MKPEKIRAIREKKGYTQTDMARILKMNRSYYSAIENGNRKPSFAKLEQIAEALGVSVKSFF